MGSEVVVFNGIRFRRYPDSPHTNLRRYYKPGGGDIVKGVGYLHQEIWKAHNGPIPPGHQIHHKDGNTLNNDPSNLEALLEAEHKSYHGKQNPEAKRLHAARIRPLAREWHGTPEGLEWHRKQGAQAWENRTTERKVCERCCKPFDSITRRDSDRFCSNGCRSASRRASGLDDEQRVCAVCGNPFTINKYIPKRTCSRACSAALRKQTMQGR